VARQCALKLLGPLSLANRQTAADHKARRRVVATAVRRVCSQALQPGKSGLVENLNNELLSEKRAGRCVPKLRRFAFSSDSPARVLGLDPVDRDALFGDFRDLVPGLFLPCRSPCSRALRQSPSGVSAS